MATLRIILKLDMPLLSNFPFRLVCVNSRGWSSVSRGRPCRVGSFNDSKEIPKSLHLKRSPIPPETKLAERTTTGLRQDGLLFWQLTLTWPES